MNHGIQAIHQFLMVIAIFGENLNLGSKYARDSLGAVTAVELCGEGMGA
jgi:hypothetical protein